MIPMFLQYDHDHSDSYTLSAKDLTRIAPGDEEVTLSEPLVFPAGVPVEVDENIGKLILEHKGLYDITEVDDPKTAKAKDGEDDAPAEPQRSGSLGASSSPGATTSALAGASSTAGSSAGSGTASGAGTGTGSSSGN